MLQPLDHPSIPDLRLTALPLSFDGERALHRSAPPAVGEHTAEVLRRGGLRERRDRGACRGRSDPNMSHVSASFSATIRVRLADAPGSFARLAEAIGEAGGSLGAIDLVRVEKGTKVRDVTVDAVRRRPPRPDRRERPRGRGRRGRARLRPHVPDAPRRQDRDALEGARQDARRPLDGLHAGRRPRLHGDRTRTATQAWNLTIKQNTVAVVSDGTAVLGLGDIGPEAAMPVMEGKALLFKEFGGVDAWPICLDTKDTDEIVAIVKAIAPGFGGINLEDISAPRCFEIEAAAARGARHPRLPRRPARHRDRRAGGAAQRAPGRRQADRGHQGRDDRRRRRRRRGRPRSCSTPASAP